MSGKVINTNGKGVEGVTIKVNQEIKAKTDING